MARSFRKVSQKLARHFKWRERRRSPGSPHSGEQQRPNRHSPFSQPGQSHSRSRCKRVHQVPLQLLLHSRTQHLAKAGDATPQNHTSRMKKVGDVRQRKTEILRQFTENSNCGRISLRNGRTQMPRLPATDRRCKPPQRARRGLPDLLPNPAIQSPASAP